MPDPVYTRYRDIPRLTRWGSYEVDVSWDYLEKHLQGWAEYAGGVDLSPDYQRAHVWNKEKQRRFVEWCLRGGRSARTIYFNCTTWNSPGGITTPIELVDGKQRLEAILRFMRNDLRAFGSLEREFTDNRRSVLVNMRVQVNDLPTRAEVLQWYLDINDGGVAHTPREIARVKALLDAEITR